MEFGTIGLCLKVRDQLAKFQQVEFESLILRLDPAEPFNTVRSAIPDPLAGSVQPLTT